MAEFQYVKTALKVENIYDLHEWETDAVQNLSGQIDSLDVQDNQHLMWLDELVVKYFFRTPFMQKNAAREDDPLRPFEFYDSGPYPIVKVKGRNAKMYFTVSSTPPVSSINEPLLNYLLPQAIKYGIGVRMYTHPHEDDAAPYGANDEDNEQEILWDRTLTVAVAKFLTIAAIWLIHEGEWTAEADAGGLIKGVLKGETPDTDVSDVADDIAKSYAAMMEA